MYVTCTFAMGTQSKGCQVQVELTSDNSTSRNPYYTLNITRISQKRNTDNSLVAEATVDLQFPSEAFEVLAFDWESDGTISDFGIPVKVVRGPIPPSSVAPSKIVCVSVCVSLSYCFFHLSPYPSPRPQATTVEPSHAPTVSPTPSTVITRSESQESSPGMLWSGQSCFHLYFAWAHQRHHQCCICYTAPEGITFVAWVEVTPQV